MFLGLQIYLQIAGANSEVEAERNSGYRAFCMESYRVEFGSIEVFLMESDGSELPIQNFKTSDSEHLIRNWFIICCLRSWRIVVDFGSLELSERRNFKRPIGTSTRLDISMQKKSKKADFYEQKIMDIHWISKDIVQLEDLWHPSRFRVFRVERLDTPFAGWWPWSPLQRLRTMTKVL